jgi:hypothetical protein
MPLSRWGTNSSPTEIAAILSWHRAAVRGGYLKATSVGFSPITWEPMAGGGIKFQTIELGILGGERARKSRRVDRVDE